MSLSGLSNGRTPAAVGWPLQAGTPAGPAELRGKSLAMGHSPEQIAGRLALEHGRVIISHESIYRFIYHRAAQKDYWHRLLPRQKRRRGHRRQRRQHRQPHQAPPLDQRTARRGRRPRDAGPLGSRLHAVRPIWPRTACSPRTTNPLQHRSASGPSKSRPHRSDHRPSARALPQAMRKTLTFDNGTEFASITGLTTTRPPDLLLRYPLALAEGRHRKCHRPLTTIAAPQNRPRLTTPQRSSDSFNATTIPHANAWTSRHPPRHSPASNQPLHFKGSSIPRLRGA